MRPDQAGLFSFFNIYSASLRVEFAVVSKTPDRVFPPDSSNSTKTLTLVKYSYCIYISPGALQPSFLSLSALCFISKSRLLNPRHKAYNTNVPPQHYLRNGPWSSEISGGGVRDLLVLLFLLRPTTLRRMSPSRRPIADRSASAGLAAVMLLWQCAPASCCALNSGTAWTSTQFPCGEAALRFVCVSAHPPHAHIIPFLQP